MSSMMQTVERRCAAIPCTEGGFGLWPTGNAARGKGEQGTRELMMMEQQ